jgi:hypothetical protein
MLIMLFGTSTAVFLEECRHNEQFCREQAERPELDRAAWLTRAAEWAALIRAQERRGG